MNTLIFGIGNPYRGDDGIGIKVANELRKNFDIKGEFVDIKSGNLDAFSLLELSREYDCLVVIDAAKTSKSKPGTIKFSNLEDSDVFHLPTSHCIDLKIAWLMWRKTFKKPENIKIVTIEIKDEMGYRDSLSKDLAHKLSDIKEKISRKLEIELKNSSSISV